MSYPRLITLESAFLPHSATLEVLGFQIGGTPVEALGLLARRFSVYTSYSNWRLWIRLYPCLAAGSTDWAAHLAGILRTVTDTLNRSSGAEPCELAIEFPAEHYEAIPCVMQAVAFHFPSVTTLTFNAVVPPEVSLRSSIRASSEGLCDGFLIRGSPFQSHHQTLPGVRMSAAANEAEGAGRISSADTPWS